jgi:putative DNA primase/helicase
MIVAGTHRQDAKPTAWLIADLEAAAGFLDRWAEPGQGRHLLLSILPDTFHPQGKTFDWPADRVTALHWIEQCGVRCGIYWTVNVCRPNLMKKAQKRDVRFLRAVWADLDPLDHPRLGERARTGPEERERLRLLAEELERLESPPTIVIDSGNGVQAIWRLTNPIETHDEYIIEIERLGRRIECALGGLENTNNIDRVLRLPGTINLPNARKRELGRVPMPTGIIYETGRLYSWRDLEALAANLEDEPPEHAIPVEFHPHRYTNGHGIDLDADLPPVATDEELEALFQNFPHLKAIWDKSTASPPEDQSPSGWDQKFTSALAREGFVPAQLAAYLRAFRAHHEPTKGKQNRPDYVWRTVDAATRDRESAAGDEEPAAAAGAGASGQASGEQQTAGDAQGKNRGTFKQGTQGKPTDDWPEPGVLGDPPAAPPFPVELLPQQLMLWVSTQAETMGIPSDVLALPALVCLAGAIGKDAVLKVKRHDLSWTERPCLWGALIMPKGSLKSPAIKAAMAPIRGAQAQARDRWDDEVREWEARQERTSKGAIKPNPEDPKPKEPKIVLGDATIEAIADAMVDSRGLTLIRDELSGLVANMSRYNKGSDRPFYLECHAGGFYTVDRIIRGRQIIPEVYLNIFGGIQPKVAKKAFALAESGEDDGFFERFGLVCYPDPIPWNGVKDEPPQRDYKQMYSDACLRLSRQDWAAALQDGIMCFDDQAQDRFLSWYDGHMRTRVRTPEAEERPDHGFLSKGAGLVIRLTITLHLFRWTCGETESASLVDLASLEPAIGLFERYCVPMYDRVCKAFGEREAHEGAARLCDHIRKKKLTRLRVADITKLHWQGMVERAPVLKALEALEDIDWLRRVSAPTRGRPSDSWLVNPKVHR